MLWIVVAGVALITIIALVVAGFKDASKIVKLASSGSYDFDIVGESNYQKALESIAGRSDESAEHYCTATLEHEMFNKYDKRAVKVSIDGKTVGYIARDVTEAFHEVMKGRTATADAIIVGGWSRGKRGSGSFGVKLDLDVPLRIERLN